MSGHKTSRGHRDVKRVVKTAQQQFFLEPAKKENLKVIITKQMIIQLKNKR